METSDCDKIGWFPKYKKNITMNEVAEVMIFTEIYSATFMLLERVIGNESLLTDNMFIGEKIMKFAECNLICGAIYSEIIRCYSSSKHDVDDVLMCIEAQSKNDEVLTKFNDEIIEKNIRDIKEIEEIFIQYVRPRVYAHFYGPSSSSVLPLRI